MPLNPHGGDWYILDEAHNPVRVKGLLEWARWIQTAERHRHVGYDEINGLLVSTIFLGLDHRHLGEGPPILFETMILGRHDDGYQMRCCTWAQAEAEHEIAKKRAAMMVVKERKANDAS